MSLDIDAIRKRQHDWYRDPRGNQTTLDLVRDREALLAEVERLTREVVAYERTVQVMQQPGMQERITAGMERDDELLAELDRLRRNQAEAVGHLRATAENVRLDLVSDEVAAQDIESVARDLRAEPPCAHESSSGVDQEPFGPDKVWRCDVCGWLHRSVRVEGCLHRDVAVQVSVPLVDLPWRDEARDRRTP